VFRQTLLGRPARAKRRLAPAEQGISQVLPQRQMNNRATLTAVGTTGVLLAASLAMLAIVSALVTFDAWPTRDRAASPSEISVEHPRAARVVRAVRRASATTGAAVAGADGAADGLRAAGGPAGNPGDGSGGGTASNPTSDGRDPSPSPHVGPSPPGEDPNAGGGDTGDGGGDGGLVDRVTTTACGASGVCGSGPDTYEDPSGVGGVELDTPPPVDLPALP
jgi:hypothetical protein